MNVPKLRFKEFDGEWEYHKFSDEIKLLGGATPLKSNKAYWNGDIVWLSSQEIKAKYVEEGTYKITQKAIDDNTTKMVKAGTPLIVSRSGILARMFPISMPTVDVAINQDIKALIFDKEQLDTDFLVGQLQAKECFILKSIVKTGTTVQSVNIPDLEKMKLSIPSSFKEQKKIGLFFKMIDEKIQLQQQKIDLLQEQKKGFLQKMFPKAGETQPEMRFDGFMREWEERKLKEVGKIITGNTPSTIDKSNYAEQGILWVTPTDIKHLITTETSKKLSIKGEKIARVVPSGTILVTCIASIGKNTMVLDKSGFNQQINSLTPNSNNDSYFLLTQSEFWSRKMKNIAASGTMQIVNKNEFSNLIFSYPTLEEQQKIGAFFKKLDENIVLQQKKLNIYKKQRQGFMQQMFI